MQLNRKTRTRIAIGIAGLLILYGILGQLFHINIDTKTVNNVSMVLMVIAFILLFGGKKPNKEKSAEKNDEITEDTNAEHNTIETLDAGQTAENNSEEDNNNS